MTWTYFPGMMDDPGSFSGSSSSPRPHRGPEPRYRISLAIFIKLTATVLRAPEASTMASCAASASNYGTSQPRLCSEDLGLTLLGAVMKSYPVILEISAATFSSNPFLVLRPCVHQSCSTLHAQLTVPTAVPPCASILRFFSVLCTRPMPLSTWVT